MSASNPSTVGSLILARPALVEQVTAANHALSLANKALDALTAQGVPTSSASYQQASSKVRNAQANLSTAQNNLAQSTATLQGAIASSASAGLSTTITEIPSSVPILMLPVRIETRYVSASDGTELWIRVYPDEIETDTFEGALTLDELGLDPNPLLPGQPANPPVQSQQQWAALATRFGPRRAAWIVEGADPTKLKTDSWTVPPATYVMPDQWVAVAWTNGSPTILGQSSPITYPLNVGPDPGAPPSSYPAQNPLNMTDLPVDSGWKWMSDFPTAVANGMAFKIPAAQVPSGGIQRLAVFGVKVSVDPITSATLLADLLDHHHYTDGIGFVPKGTPAHNSGTITSGYTTSDPGYLTSFGVEMGKVDDSQKDDSGNPFATYGQYLAVQFIAGGPDIVAINLWLQTVQLNPSATLGNLVVDICADNAGQPGTVLASGTLEPGDVLATASWIPVTLGYSPVAGSKYWIVLNAAGADVNDCYRLFSANNTSGTRLYATSTNGSAWTVNSGGNAFAFQVLTEQFATHTTVDQMTDAELFAHALGIDSSYFEHVANAGRTQRQDARNMMTAVWPSTMGYYLQQMLLTPQSTLIEPLREYAVEYLCPSGLLPTLRIGGTPYGFLPAISMHTLPEGQPYTVSSSAGWQGMVQRVFQSWLGFASSVPTIGSTNDPDNELVSVFGMDSNSGSYAVRYALAAEYMKNLLDFIGVPASSVATWSSEATTLASAGLSAMGLTGIASSTPILGMVFDDQSYSMRIPPVQDEAVPSQPIPTNQNYLTWLTSANIADLQNGKTGMNKPHPYSLLFKVLRASVLRSYADAAFQLLLANGSVIAADASEPVFVNILSTTQTVWTRFNMTIPSEGGSVAVGSYLENPANQTSPLSDVLGSIGELASLTTGDLALHFSGVLDAFSHRFDAWATSIANYRLMKNRAAGQQGICLGAYAWIENLPPPPTGTEQATTVASSGLTPEQVGYIHAPSVSQAVAAALLRNAYVSGADSRNGYGTPIDLSSYRVNRALTLLQGIRDGCSINTMLGSIFEDDLNESNLPQYIQAFRDAYPLAANNPPTGATPTENVTPRNVVDGYALEQAWINSTIPFGTGGLPATSSSDYNGVVAAVEDLVDIMDSVNDVSVAETAYQFARGNYSATTGIMNAISQGKRPPVPEFVDSKHTGVALTNRFVLALSSTEITLPANWPNPSATNNPRATAEPLLNAWVGMVLGDPTQVACTVTTSNVDPSIDGVPQVVTLADLQLNPLDVLYLGVSDGTPRAGEVEQRISYYVLQPYASNITNQSTATIAFVPAPSGATTTFPQILELASAIRGVINSSRYLTAADIEPLSVPTPPSAAAPNVTDLAARESAIQALVTDSINAINTQLSALGVTPTDPSAIDRQTQLTNLSGRWTAAGGPPASLVAAVAPLCATLLTASMLGGAGTIPVSSNAMPQQNLVQLVQQALSIYDNLSARLNSVTQAMTGATNPSADDLISWIRLLLSKDFPVLPLFTPDATTLTGLQSSLASTTLVPSETSLFSWFQQVSHVRDHVQNYDIMATYAEIMGTGLSLQLEVAQLPFKATDVWAAVATGNSPAITPGTLSLVFAQPSSALATGEVVSGLVIDDWTEMVENAAETTGVAYHYDDPNSQAPQTALIAVTPYSNENPWTLDYLVSLLYDTFDLARIRCVDPDQPGVRNQLVPAMTFADNREGETITTRLRGHSFA